MIQVLGSQDLQEKRVSKASQDFQEYQERRVLGVMRVCQASQDCKESRETKDLLATQVSQVDQARRVSLGYRDLQENLAMTVGLVNLACKDLLVFQEKREILDWMASLDPQGREETQVYLAVVSLDNLECLVTKVTKVVLASLALQVIQVSLVSKVTRDFQVHRESRVSQERGGSQVSLLRALKESEEKQDNPEKEDPQEDQDPLVCQAETAKREKKETRVFLVSRESQDKRAILEFLDFLGNLAFQVLMDRRERGDCRVSLASQVLGVMLGTLDSKETLETEDSLEKRAMKAPLVLPAPALSSKETLASQGFKAYRDLRDHLGSPGRKDSRV